MKLVALVAGLGLAASVAAAQTDPTRAEPVRFEPPKVDGGQLP